MRIAQPAPELPVPDVVEAQAYFRDRFGFEIAWHNEDGGIGAVAHGDCAIFLRQSDVPPIPATFWIFAEDVDTIHAQLAARGADLVDPVADKPWGLRQFTLRDAWGNLFYFHHDL